MILNELLLGKCFSAVRYAGKSRGTAKYFVDDLREPQFVST